MTSTQDALWEDLLHYIENGLVLPIIGQDVATITVAGRDVRLYDLLAERLAERLNITIGSSRSGMSLNDVAGQYVAQGGRKLRVHLSLHEILSDPESFPIPELLRKLASIEPLKLIVTTTFDSLMERALNEVRFGGEEKTDSFAFSPDDTKDIQRDFRSLERPAVFHLLGRISPTPNFAVTDLDVLEFVHSLQAGTQTPLFDELRERELLFLGCSFPDWLTRFLIRAARGKLLDAETSLVVADDTVRLDSGLVHFLERFSKSTTVFAGSLTEFVHELHERWTARPKTSIPATAPDGPARTPSMPEGAVFLSYATEDIEAAQSIRDALEHAGVDVWFDKDDLNVGEEYESKIRRHIEKASLFIPIISQHTVTREKRFFRLEWAEAQEVAKMAAGEFIMPVVIDETSYDDETIPERFRKLHWDKLDGPTPRVEFVDRIKELYRDYQKAVAGVG